MDVQAAAPPTAVSSTRQCVCGGWTRYVVCQYCGTTDPAAVAAGMMSIRPLVQLTPEQAAAHQPVPAQAQHSSWGYDATPAPAMADAPLPAFASAALPPTTFAEAQFGSAPSAAAVFTSMADTTPLQSASPVAQPAAPAAAEPAIAAEAPAAPWAEAPASHGVAADPVAPVAYTEPIPGWSSSPVAAPSGWATAPAAPAPTAPAAPAPTAPAPATPASFAPAPVDPGPGAPSVGSSPAGPVDAPAASPAVGSPAFSAPAPPSAFTAPAAFDQPVAFEQTSAFASADAPAVVEPAPVAAPTHLDRLPDPAAAAPVAYAPPPAYSEQPPTYSEQPPAHAQPSGYPAPAPLAEPWPDPVIPTLGAPAAAGPDHESAEPPAADRSRKLPRWALPAGVAVVVVAAGAAYLATQGGSDSTPVPVPVHHVRAQAAAQPGAPAAAAQPPLTVAQAMPAGWSAGAITTVTGTTLTGATGDTLHTAAELSKAGVTSASIQTFTGPAGLHVQAISETAASAAQAAELAPEGHHLGYNQHAYRGTMVYLLHASDRSPGYTTTMPGWAAKLQG